MSHGRNETFMVGRKVLLFCPTCERLEVPVVWRTDLAYRTMAAPNQGIWCCGKLMVLVDERKDWEMLGLATLDNLLRYAS